MLKLQNIAATKVPPTVEKALGQTKKKKIQNASVIKLIGTAYFQKVEGLDPKLWIRSSTALFSVQDPETQFPKWTKIQLDSSDSVEHNAKLIATTIRAAIDSFGDASQTITENDPPFTANNVHAAIEADVSGLDAVPLPDAQQWYQATRSTGSGSRYSYLARHLNSGAKLAVRLRGSKVSVRMEPLPEGVKKDSQLLGLNDNGTYASVHFEAGSDIVLTRYAKMLGAVLEGWEVAPFNEKKIREVSA